MALTLDQIYFLSRDSYFQKMLEVAVNAEAARQQRLDPKTLPSYDSLATTFHHVTEATMRRTLARQVTGSPNVLREKVLLAGELILVKTDEAATEAGKSLVFPPTPTTREEYDGMTPEKQAAVNKAFFDQILPRPMLEQLVADRWAQLAGFDLNFELAKDEVSASQTVPV